MNAPLRPGDRVTFDPTHQGCFLPFVFAATVRSELFYIPGSSLGPFILIDADDPKQAVGIVREGHRMVNAKYLIRISNLREKINKALDDLERKES